MHVTHCQSNCYDHVITEDTIQYNPCIVSQHDQKISASSASMLHEWSATRVYQLGIQNHMAIDQTGEHWQKWIRKLITLSIQACHSKLFCHPLSAPLVAAKREAGLQKPLRPQSLLVDLHSWALQGLPKYCSLLLLYLHNDNKQSYLPCCLLAHKLPNFTRYFSRPEDMTLNTWVFYIAGIGVDQIQA